MKLMRQFVATSVVAGSMLLPVGGALADNVTLNAAGPESNQDVQINDSNSVVESNVNTIVVTNSNTQEAVTGDVTATDNTSVGDVNSGSASNTNGTSTAVVVDNTPSVISGGAGAADDTQPTTSNTPAGGAGQTTGTVLGSSTTGGGLGGAVATLPVTGPSQPVDVSALRAAWQANVATPTTAVVQATRTSSQFMFTLAALLSALGAMANVAYLRRKERRS